MMPFISLLCSIFLLGTTSDATNRLLLQNICGNCGINPCYGCVNGQCQWLPGCCMGDSNCNAGESCIGRFCQAAYIPIGVDPAIPCIRQFCACPMIYDPVECSDGRQYPNECQAECECQQNCNKIY
eukprot:UN02638